MHSIFCSQFEYNYDLNQKWIRLIEEHADQVNELIIKLFSHTLNAHCIWNDRIEKIKSTVGVWDITSVDTWRQTNKLNFERSMHILKGNDLNEVITYRTSLGEPFSSAVSDILFHIINHSTHHRGQIAMECRRSGIEPIVSDYIFYKRTSQ